MEGEEGEVTKRVLRWVALKKPVKLTGERPTKAKFQAFMETAQRISHPSILPYEGVLLLESIQMPIMEPMLGSTFKQSQENGFQGLWIRE